MHSTSVAVPREHRRAKTDRLDTDHLKRAFFGWLQGEPNHCQMGAIPSLDEEDAWRPIREREKPGQRTNRHCQSSKARLIRLDIAISSRRFRRASERLKALRTPEGRPLPPNTVAEMCRGVVRLRRSGTSRRLD